jgi:hypothetical protein
MGPSVGHLRPILSDSEPQMVTKGMPPATPPPPISLASQALWLDFCKKKEVLRTGDPESQACDAGARRNGWPPRGGQGGGHL